MTRWPILYVSAALTSVLSAQRITPQSSPSSSSRGAARIAVATRVAKAPTMHGRLDDSVWKSAPVLTGFTQRELHEGEPTTERTEVRIVTDGEALYIGAWLYDREPLSIVRGEKVRDGSLENGDAFAIILDTYRDRQNGFVFATTPAGIEYDGQVVKEGEGGAVQQSGQSRAVTAAAGGFNLSWDGSWTVVTSVDSLGWFAEFRIPFSTLRYGGGTTQTWGLNFERRIRRKNEDAFWSFVPREFTLYRLSRAGAIEIKGIPARQLTTMTPYVVGRSRRDFTAGTGARQTNDAGIDVKYGVTPGLVMDLTYNTDFAQVEVDDQRTNLTRFPLFYPEKRGFFLENAGFFSEGTPQAVELFFSRRIGIDSAGNPVPIRGGGRLSGHAQGISMGMLEIVTAADSLQPANSYSVARLTRELSRRSRVGVAGMQRVAVDSAGNRNGTYALDGRVGVGDAWTLDWWGAKTVTPGSTRDDYGYSTRAAFNTANWNHSARVVRVGPAFNPEIGFLNRSGGYTYYELISWRFVRFAQWPWLKDWAPHNSYRAYYTPDGFLQEGWLHIHPTEFELASGGRIGPELNFYHEGLQQPFKIAANVKLPVGTYDYTTLAFNWETNASAPLSLVYRGDFGNFYNGTRTGSTVTLTGHRGASISSSLLVDFQDVHLAQGHFVRKLTGVRFAYFFTPRVFVQSLTQYTNQARIWTENARFGWLSTAGTGLYLVLNDGENADGFFSWRQPQSRSITLKFARQFGTGWSQ